ncbi:MAG TPA: class I SAM-dependent methyltransferase [Blastocatellia bacterium]
MQAVAKQRETDKADCGSGPAESACAGCRQSARHSLGYKGDYEFVCCEACGTISTRAPASGTVSSRQIYDQFYEGATFQTPQIATASLNRLADSFERFRRTGRWLDIGYGEGSLLSIAESKGWSCYGTELATHALDYGKRRGWTVSANAEVDPRFHRAAFDVVTMVEFLEHVHESDLFLRAAADWLRPGGLLYLTTPNALSFNRRLLGLDWSIFTPPEHVIIWTRDGLKSAFERNGFQALQMRTEGLNPCEIKARFAGSGQSNAPINRQDAAVRLNEAMSSSPLRRAIKRTLNQCLSSLRIGDTIKAWAIRK